MTSSAVPLRRLLQIANPFEDCPWGTDGVTEQAVRLAVADGRLTDVPFCPDTARWDVLQHVERIAHFVVRGWSEPISLDIGVPGMGPAWPVTDGNHRLCAAVVLGADAISALVSGDVDLAKELLGVDI